MQSLLAAFMLFGVKPYIIAFSFHIGASLLPALEEIHIFARQR